jgi:hypothetical protein
VNNPARDHEVWKHGGVWTRERIATAVEKLGEMEERYVKYYAKYLSEHLRDPIWVNALLARPGDDPKKTIAWMEDDARTPDREMIDEALQRIFGLKRSDLGDPVDVWDGGDYCCKLYKVRQKDADPLILVLGMSPDGGEIHVLPHAVYRYWYRTEISEGLLQIGSEKGKDFSSLEDEEAQDTQSTNEA